MRVLLSTTAGAGHFGPIVPFGRACADAGHEVRVAAPASFAGDVARAGFAHEPFADAPADEIGRVFSRLPQLAREEADAVVIGDVFGRLDAQAALPGLTALLDRWRPDVVLRDPTEFASLAAALRAGVPHAQVAIGLDREAPAFVRATLLEPLGELARLVGLPDATVHDAAFRAPTLTTVPASLDGEADAPADAAPPVWRFRAGTPPLDGRLPPPWGDPALPLVYVSFGSVAGGQPPFAPIYRAALEALAEEPVRVLMTTGEAHDLASLGTPPPNARVERWWPQADVMPHAAAVVGHGGFGTTMLSLAAGLPQVIIPLFSFDQFVNAERVHGIGAGVMLTGGVHAATALPGAVRAVLTEARHREASRAAAAEIAALPHPSAAVPVIEALAR